MIGLRPITYTALVHGFRCQYTGKTVKSIINHLTLWTRKMQNDLAAQELNKASLSLVHFANWWGKRFLSAQHGINLFADHRGLREHFPFTMSSMASLVDGKAGVIVQYKQSAPFPWPYVIDELRFIEPDCLLGMTVVNVGVLSKLPLTFLLHFWENHNGL